MPEPADPSERLERLFNQYAGRVYSYACARVGPDSAPDVVSETFMAAWRRIDSVPNSGLSWLLAAARNVVANELRGRARRLSLKERLVATSVRSAIPESAEYWGVIDALGRLSEADQEVLLVSAWYELSSREAAQVLGCLSTTYSVRLHRARRRLRQELLKCESMGSASDDSAREVRR